MIIVDDIVQGDAAWVQARLGRITASGADNLVSPTGKVRTGQMPASYRRELIAEILTGAQVVGRGAAGSYWVERGVEIEGQARAWFEFQTGLQGRSVAVVFRDEARRVACSPDWIVQDERAAIYPGFPMCPVELKAPAPWTHIGYVLDGVVPEAYRAQCQFQLYCMDEAPHGFFASYHPQIKGLCIKVERDEAFQAAIDAAVKNCIAKMDQELAQLRAA